MIRTKTNEPVEQTIRRARGSLGRIIWAGIQVAAIRFFEPTAPTTGKLDDRFDEENSGHALPAHTFPDVTKAF